MNKVKNRSIRVDRVLRMFSKSGGNGEFTMPFSEFPDSIQSDLILRLHNKENEIVILVSYRSPDSWVAITSDRLVWYNDKERHSLKWEQIKDATIPMSALCKLKASAKQENTVLEIATDSGKVEIVIEAGRPFSGFWNVLKMVPLLRED